MASATDYFAYWNGLKDDKQLPRKALTLKKGDKTVKRAAQNSNKQGPKLRATNRKPPKVHKLSTGTAKVWFSPNTKQPTVPKKSPARPADLAEVYRLMDDAKEAIMFLVFMPGRSGAITSGPSAWRAAGTTVWISPGRKITVTPPLFPGYAFVLIVSGWWNARWAAGVRRLVMDGLQ